MIIKITFGVFSRQRIYLRCKYMKKERCENDRPDMKQIRVKDMNKYDGAFSDVIGDFDADMALDADGSEQ